MFASLWVRYLGGTHYHCADTFPSPTTEVPERAQKLWARGDVAEVWYAFDGRDPNTERHMCAMVDRP